VTDTKRMYRTIWRRQRDVDRFPRIDPARLPTTEYSKSDRLDWAREDLAYLRSTEHPETHEAWIETRMEPPWERTDD